MLRYSLHIAFFVSAVAHAQLDTGKTVPQGSADSAHAPREARLDGREVHQRQSAADGSVRVVEREELARSFSVAEILAREPGVLVQSYGGGLGGYSVLSMRGSPSEQVVVRLDGIDQGGSAGSAADLGVFGLDGLERMELRQASSSGGEGAPRLELVSRRGWAHYGGSMRTGSFGEKGATGWWGSPDGKISTAVWWEAARNDYSFPWNNGTEYNTSDDYVRELGNNDFQGWGGAVGFRPAEDWEASARYQSSEKGLTSLYLADPHGRLERSDAQGRIAYRREGGWAPQGEVSWRHGISDWQDPGRTTGYQVDLRSQETSDDIRSRFGVARQEDGWFDPSLFFGARWERSDRLSLGRSDVPVTPDGRRWSVSGDLGWKGRDDRGFGAELSTNATWIFDRRDYASGLNGAKDGIPVEVDRSTRRGSARIWWAPWQDLTIWVGGSIQERAPDFPEWMGATGGSLPNLDLQPESSRTSEFGSEWKGSWFKVSGALWMAEYQDPIQAEMAGGSPFLVHRNGPGNQSRGLDGKAFACWRWVSLDLSGTIQDATIHDGNPALDGKEPARTPRAKGSAAIGIGPWRGLQGGYVLDGQSSVFASTLNSRADFRPSWAMHGLWGRYRRGGVSLSAMVKNIGDVQLPDQEDLPMEGRQFLARLDLDFSYHSKEPTLSEGNQK